MEEIIKALTDIIDKSKVVSQSPSSSNEDKDKMKVLFQATPTYGGIMLKCNNCNFSKKIKETIRLYQLNVSSVYSVYRSQDDNKLLFLNPIYPRTRDYSCKNVNCITHKDETNKESVFFREKDSYLTNYNLWMI